MVSDVQNWPKGKTVVVSVLRGLPGNVVCHILPIIAALVVVGCVRQEVVEAPESCEVKLRMIHGAKENWALSHGATNGQAVTWTDIVPYLKGEKIPVCPEGGRYILGNVGDLPECSFPGHRIHIGHPAQQ